MERLISKQIDTEEQVEEMRLIYNDNLEDLATIKLNYNTYDEQQLWWKNNENAINAYLYYLKDDPDKGPIAFLALTDRGDFKTPIFAIKKKYWGKGFGKEIIQDYLIKANCPLAGSQLQDNKAICYMNRKFKWEIIGESCSDGKIIDLLFHPGLNDEKRDKKIFREILSFHNIDS